MDGQVCRSAGGVRQHTRVRPFGAGRACFEPTCEFLSSCQLLSHQKSHCTVILAIRAVMTPVGASHAADPDVTAGLNV